MDRVVCAGYEALATLLADGRGDGELAMELVEDPSTGARSSTATRKMDGYGFSGRYQLEQVRRGLIRIRVTVTWAASGTASSPTRGSIVLSRFVADPGEGP
jgi:hypothetical protein